MKKCLAFIPVMLIAFPLTGQIDPALLKSPAADSVRAGLNMDEIYNRPMLSSNKIPVTLGGYLEVNWLNSSTDGVGEGHQFQFRRFTIFTAATITNRIKFLSELEFEDGTKEIALEFAAVDIQFHSFLNLRAGIITNPIGAFNQNHDGPKWEFTDRPISSTQLLPATFSNAGAGIYGKNNRGNWMIGYEAYITNGLNNSIIENGENRTFLPAAKRDPFRFEESSNGKPMLTTKLALRNTKTGELGISYMGGIYNKFNDDGLIVDVKRRCDVVAIDYNTTIPGSRTFITAEWAWIFVDIPVTYSAQFARRQHGGFTDIVQPVLKRKILTWDEAVLNIACRLEFVDWNSGKFDDEAGDIGDETWSIMPALSFRPVPQTVIRFNYRYQQTTDLFGNPPANTGAFSLGLSSYF